MRDIVLALFIFGTIPFILMRPYVGLLVWSWLGYMNPHRLCYGFAYSFPWVQLIAITTLVSWLLSKESKKIAWSTVSVLLVVFLAWAGVTTFFAAVPDAAWQKWQEFAKVLMMVFVTLMLVNNRERMHWLVWVIVISLGFYGVKGGIFTILGGGVNHVLGPPDSFIGNNNDIALALCMILPLMRYLQLHATTKAVRIAWGVSMAFTGVAVLGTYSRGGLIGLVVVSAALFVKSRRRLTMVLLLLTIGATAYHFMPPQWMARMETLRNPTEVNSAETRIQSWEFATNVAIHHPLVGAGFDAYTSTPLWQAYAPEGAKQRAVHSIYFRVLNEQGFPGLILFLAILFFSWRNCGRVRKQTRDSPEQKWACDLAAMLQVSLVAFMAAGAFLTRTYFDLTFQLMALTELLALHVRQSAAQPAVAAGPGVLPAPAARKAVSGGRA